MLDHPKMTVHEHRNRQAIFQTIHSALGDFAIVRPGLDNQAPGILESRTTAQISRLALLRLELKDTLRDIKQHLENNPYLVPGSNLVQDLDNILKYVTKYRNIAESRVLEYLSVQDDPHLKGSKLEWWLSSFGFQDAPQPPEPDNVLVQTFNTDLNPFHYAKAFLEVVSTLLWSIQQRQDNAARGQICKRESTAWYNFESVRPTLTVEDAEEFSLGQPADHSDELPWAECETWHFLPLSSFEQHWFEPPVTDFETISLPDREATYRSNSAAARNPPHQRQGQGDGNHIQFDAGHNQRERQDDRDRRKNARNQGQDDRSRGPYQKHGRVRSKTSIR